MKSYDSFLTEVQAAMIALADVPHEFRDYALCTAAVARDGWELVAVPKQLRDYKMCRLAFNNCGLSAWWLIEYVPKELTGREFLEIIANAKCDNI
jgi:hypothetical protein